MPQIHGRWSNGTENVKFSCSVPPPTPGPEDAHMWQSHPGKGKHLYRLMGALVFIKVHSLTKRLEIRLEKLPKRKPKMLESNRGGGVQREECCNFTVEYLHFCAAKGPWTPLASETIFVSQLHQFLGVWPWENYFTSLSLFSHLYSGDNNT